MNILTLQTNLKTRIFRPPIIDDHSFRALIEKSSDVIVLIDKKARILYASPPIVRIFGRPYKEFLGLSSFRFIHPLDIPKIIKSLATLVIKPKEAVSTDLRVKHKNGNWMWLSVTATNLINDPKIKGIVVNFHDITTQKELEERKNEFISIASHELKTPITAIKGYEQILKKYLTKDKIAQNYLSKMDHQINILTNVINDLLDVSKIQEGKLELQKSYFKIDNLIKDVKEEMQLTTDKHKIIVKGKTKSRILADEYRISQVLTNLISNAIKYSPNGGNIIIIFEEKDNLIIITIKDYGIGIPKKDLSKIFEKFYQTEKKNKQPGLGLGLYICKILIDMHGGKIWVESQKNKGSKFIFTLPKK